MSIDPAVAVGLAGALVALVAVIVGLRGDGPPRPEVLEARDRALASPGTLVETYLVRLSGPALASRPVLQVASSPMHARIQAMLLAAGRPYGGSVEVFLAAQAAALVLGSLGVLAALVVGPGALMAGILLLSVALAAYPTANTRDRARRRSRSIDAQLPDFVELLLIRIGGGQSLRVALRRTADALDGPVPAEMRTLLRLLDAQAMPDADAYELIASSLGTPNARAFCSTLSQGDLEGTKMTHALTGLASTLRVQEYQRMRVENGKLPTKLVVIMALHLMPLLFIVVLLPAALSFGKLQ